MITFTLITANSLIAKNIDGGSMACYLATPVSRVKVAITQGSAANAQFGNGILDIGPFLKVNILGFFLFFVVGAYSYLFSCLFNDSKYSIFFSAGLTILFYIANTIGNMSESFDWLKKISIFGFFNPAEIISGSIHILVPSLCYMAAGSVLYGVSVLIFHKKGVLHPYR